MSLTEEVMNELMYLLEAHADNMCWNILARPKHPNALLACHLGESDSV